MQRMWMIFCDKKSLISFETQGPVNSKILFIEQKEKKKNKKNSERLDKQNHRQHR